MMFATKTMLTKGVALVLATSTLGLTATAGFSPAEAGHRRGHGNAGAAAAVGIIGGLAAGALIAGAARPAYGAPVVRERGPASYGRPAY